MEIRVADRPVELLVVEDNPGDVRLLREALKESRGRFHLRVAQDGIEALAAAHEAARGDAPLPDLILLDLNLPRKPGREVLEALKDDPALRSIPVVVLTSSEDAGDIAHAYATNANSYVTKPTDLDDYLRVVRAIEGFWFRTAKLPTRATA